MRIKLVLLGIVVLTAFACEQWKTENKSSEQRVFGVEGDAVVQHPVTIPSRIMKLLGEDEDIKQLLENENLAADKLPPNWFSAAQRSIWMARPSGTG